jgi:hypothetical protein
MEPGRQSAISDGRWRAIRNALRAESVGSIGGATFQDGLEAKANEWKPLINESQGILAEVQKVEAELEKEIAKVKPVASVRDAPKDLREKLKIRVPG